MHQQALSNKDILSEDVDDAKNNSIRNDKTLEDNIVSNMTGSWILGEHESALERISNNDTKAEEGSKQRRSRKKKEKRKGRAKVGLTRAAYNESKLNEEWEDYIFKR